MNVGPAKHLWPIEKRYARKNELKTENTANLRTEEWQRRVRATSYSINTVEKRFLVGGVFSFGKSFQNFEFFVLIWSNKFFVCILIEKLSVCLFFYFCVYFEVMKHKHLLFSRYVFNINKMRTQRRKNRDCEGETARLLYLRPDAIESEMEFVFLYFFKKVNTCRPDRLKMRSCVYTFFLDNKSIKNRLWFLSNWAIIIMHRLVDFKHASLIDFIKFYVPWNQIYFLRN